MRIGFNMLLWTTHVVDEHFRLFGALRRAGYEGVEIPVFQGDEAHFRRVGEAAESEGMDVTAVTVLPDEAHSAVSESSEHRRGAVDRLCWAIDCASAAGAGVLAGPFHQPLGAFTGEPPTHAERDFLVDVATEAADYAAGCGIVLSIEPLNRFECYVLNTVADAAEIVRRVDRPNFGLLYDTFHANIEEKDPVGVIAPNIEAINHVHISENDRGTPGRGHVPFRTTLRALRSAGYDGWLTIEAFGRALPALAAATRVWRDFFPSREEVYLEGIETIRQGWGEA